MIYFIRTKKHVKIGYSKDPEKRLKELQTGNPIKLKLVGTIPGTYQTEAAIHKMFKKNRAVGEWFHYTGHLKRCMFVLGDNKNYRHTIITIKDLEASGIELGMRQAANRKRKRGKPQLSKAIKKYDKKFYKTS